MREPVRRGWGALAVAVFVRGATACGGGSKPPMVPDAPDPAYGLDAAAETPPSAAPAVKK